MKILFSADWHLGYTLGGANPQSRLGDQRRNLDLVARYCDEHQVDVLAIAGDLFEAQERGAARAAVSTPRSPPPRPPAANPPPSPPSSSTSSKIRASSTTSPHPTPSA